MARDVLVGIARDDQIPFDNRFLIQNRTSPGTSWNSRGFGRKRLLAESEHTLVVRWSPLRIMCLQH